MRIRIKKTHENAVIPKYAHFGDAAVDLVAVRKWEDDHGNVCYGTGLAMEIPIHHVGLLFPRSSISRTDLRLSNAVGVIDSGYRGEIIVKFDLKGGIWYKVGDRIAQLLLVPIPSINFVEVVNLPKSDRDTGSFGSSGN
jgi:dUTP pyrophosphatase